MQIPRGWKLIIVDEKGTVMDDLQVGGYDLGKPFARNLLAEEISTIVEREITARKAATP